MRSILVVSGATLISSDACLVNDDLNSAISAMANSIHINAFKQV